ncbi:MAG: ABC transporter ATP-binding protein [Acidothermaceae bacterium]
MAPTQHFRELALHRISRSFGAHAALRELEITIAGGEFVALLGPSGCGKSTALNCLAGLLPLTGGYIEQDGKRIDVLPPERRGFGMVFQNYALFPHMSVERNVAFGLRMRKVNRQETKKRVAQALSLVQLGDQAKKFPAQLSGGQQQRVAIARAVALEPSVVLMDEPLSNLDAKLRIEMRGEIRRLHQTLGLTTVYVTHDQEEALSLADRIVVLREGVVQQIGTPEQVYAAPSNQYVASFMGFRTMLDATAVGGTDMLQLEVAGARLAGTNAGAQRTPGTGPVVAAIRPDDVEVAAEGVEAVIEIVEYHGRQLAAQARLVDGQVIHLKSLERLAPGDSVRLAVPPDRVLVYPSTGLPADQVALTHEERVDVAAPS